MGNEAESTTAGRIGNSGSPPYFHLLWDEDIEQLACIINLLRDRRGEVLHHWYQLYRLHLGESCTLSELDFEQMYGRDLETIVSNLSHKDMERFVAELRGLGERLVERKNPSTPRSVGRVSRPANKRSNGKRDYLRPILQPANLKASLLQSGGRCPALS